VAEHVQLNKNITSIFCSGKINWHRMSRYCRSKFYFEQKQYIIFVLGNSIGIECHVIANLNSKFSCLTTIKKINTWYFFNFVLVKSSDRGVMLLQIFNPSLVGWLHKDSDIVSDLVDTVQVKGHFSS